MPVSYLRGYRAFLVCCLHCICFSSTQNKQTAKLKLLLVKLRNQHLGSLWISKIQKKEGKKGKQKGSEII